MIYNITASIVLFKSNIDEVNNVLDILLKSNLKINILLIDNSPTAFLKEKIMNAECVEYIFTGKNIGFGRGHNIAIEKSVLNSEFHLVLNSDIKFDADILEDMYFYMTNNADIGLLGPKVLNLDGSLQYSAKLLPNPINLIVRRFLPLKALQDRMNYNYELRFFDFNRIIEAPYLSGCFMFISCKALEEIKGFDNRFFMYPEDIDLTRQIHLNYRTIYYPKVSVFHEHGKGSYKSIKLLYFHVSSMIKYFNKWGWIFDTKRREVNKKTLKQFH